MAYKLSTDKTYAETERELAECFRKWGVREWSAEPNVPKARVNALTLSQAERAVTVHYMKDGKPITLSLDTQRSPGANLRALYLSLDAMRMIDARGVGSIVQSAYMQLGAPKTERDPWEVLGLRPGASKDEIEVMFKAKAKVAHPDAGGSHDAMTELNAARERALAEAK